MIKNNNLNDIASNIVNNTGVTIRNNCYNSDDDAQ